MKSISEGLYARGKNGMKYCRRRIPAALRAAYPQQQTHIIRSLRTSDLREAKKRLKAEILRIDAEFEQYAQQLRKRQSTVAAKRLQSISDEQLQSLAQFWVRQVLLTDERERSRGLDDVSFGELGGGLETQRKELGQMLAQGSTERILPALQGFLHLCGLEVELSPDESQRAGYAFLRGVVTALDHQRARHQGEVVSTDTVAPAGRSSLKEVLEPAHAHGPTWDEIFEVWRKHVPSRPKSTAIATQTPWRDLKKFGASKGLNNPAGITPELMSEFVQGMRDRGLAVDTINERLSKIRAVFKIAVGRHKLITNPAAGTLGFKKNSFEKRHTRRLPFDQADLNCIFGSPVFVEHLRSRGQGQEASYWIPVMMYYTGTRPEEVAGLALADIQRDATQGWYLNIIDSPSAEDDDLFDDVPKSHHRTLKNAASVRKIPVAQELIELGLLRYIDWVREQGAIVLFPTLKVDWHGKLSGALSKWFGRYKKAIGITNPKKVLYSFRHTMKDLLEEAQVPSKYLKRILGHASGDGAITDGYGSVDVPLHLVIQYFKQINFPPIPAKPWQPGTGHMMLRGEKDNVSG